MGCSPPDMQWFVRFKLPVDALQRHILISMNQNLFIEFNL
jgi:hypothetical protein